MATTHKDPGEVGPRLQSYGLQKWGKLKDPAAPENRNTRDGRH